MKLPSLVKNFLGAFADGAVLFPLLAVLTLRTDFSGPILLATAGMAYWAAGLLFRIPMSVQPLKSIAIAAIATGASSQEVRISSAVLGLACVLLTLIDVNRLAEKVPAALIHGLQLALGLLLIRQGLTYGTSPVVFALVAAMILVPRWSGVSLLGPVATGGLLWTLFRSAPETALPVDTGLMESGWRPAMIASLALPQIVLTLGNSVLGTRDVARRAFGKCAERVTIGSLLRSIGLGNLISSAVGGLPFCHGSGGLTAHIRGGATHWISNALIGTSLLILSGIAFFGGQLQLQFPPMLLASLLMATGIFHLQLAAPTWTTSPGKSKLLILGGVILLTQNMLWVAAVGVLLELAPLLLKGFQKETPA